MKISACKLPLFSFCVYIILTAANSAEKAPRNLALAPGGLGDDFIALFWDKPDPVSNTTVTGYSIFANGTEVLKTSKLHAFVKNLTPSTKYTFTVRANGSGGQSANSNEFVITTRPKATVFNVLDYGAKGDGKTDDWNAIKAAIDACTPGGKVYFPGNKTYITGSIRIMKSDICLYIGDSAMIQANPAKVMPQQNDTSYFFIRRSGSTDADRSPTLILVGNQPDRESVGFKTESQKRVVQNVRIYGNGKIYCSLVMGGTLPNSLISATATMRARNVLWQGLTIYGGSGWLNTIDYSDNVTIMDCKVGSPEPEKSLVWCWADGWNPVFSNCIYFMGCDFATADDCIAFKTEKCRSGGRVNLCPLLEGTGYVHHVRITNCRFFKSDRASGITCGSELTFGVSDVFIQDCEGNAGFLIKGAPDRGGFVRNIVMKDCNMPISAFNYYTDCNSTGPAPNDIRDLHFENCTFPGYTTELCTSVNQPIKNVTFINCKTNGRFSMKGPCDNWKFYGCTPDMKSSCTNSTVAAAVPDGYKRLELALFPCATNPSTSTRYSFEQKANKTAANSFSLKDKSNNSLKMFGIDGRQIKNVSLQAGKIKIMCKDKNGFTYIILNNLIK